MVDTLRKLPKGPQVGELLRVERDIRCDTGLNAEQFSELFQMVPSLIDMFGGDRTAAENALHMFLMRLRKGNTYEDIGNTFYVCDNTASTHISKARDALMLDFVGLYLGFQSRDFLLENTTLTSRKLFSTDDTEKAIVIMDGTYIYCEKSMNYTFQ